MRIFDTNWLHVNFGGLIKSSSGFAEFCFDEDLSYGWVSDNQALDGQTIAVERNLESLSSANRIFIKNTNISDMKIYISQADDYQEINSLVENVIVSQNKTCYLFELQSSVNILNLKIEGSKTITANQEKTIGQIYAFNQIGQITDIADIKPKRVRKQKVSELLAGKTDIINLGSYFNFKLSFKSHAKTEDVGSIEKLVNNDDSMFIWFNDNNEEVINMPQEPFRFEDIYKVAIKKDDSPSFNQNLFFSGINNSINLVEVA